MDKFKRYIGLTFKVQGFNEPRTVKVDSVYLLGGKVATFKCYVVGDYKYFKNGDRENFQCRDVVKNNRLVESIRVLTA